MEESNREKLELFKLQYNHQVLLYAVSAIATLKSYFDSAKSLSRKKKLCRKIIYWENIIDEIEKQKEGVANTTS